VAAATVAAALAVAETGFDVFFTLTAQATA
jgi:hypothetical protein